MCLLISCYTVYLLTSSSHFYAMFRMRRRHLTRSCASSPDNSVSDKSFLMLSNHRFGLPLLLFPIISFSPPASPSLPQHLLLSPSISFSSPASPSLPQHLLLFPSISFSPPASPSLLQHLLLFPSISFSISFSSPASPSLPQHLLLFPSICFSSPAYPSLPEHLLLFPSISFSSPASPSLPQHLHHQMFLPTLFYYHQYQIGWKLLILIGKWLLVNP